MKIFESADIQSIELEGIRAGLYSSLELMNRAAECFVSWVCDFIEMEDEVVCICGKGNNGADGLVIAEKLRLRGYSVEIIVVNFSNHASSEFTFHIDRLTKQRVVPFRFLNTVKTLPDLRDKTIVDGLFGNGLNRPLAGEYADLVNEINRNCENIFSIDIPSGLPADGIAHGATVRSKATLSFEFPKIAFFLAENFSYIPDWECESIGLEPSTYAHRTSNYEVVDAGMIQSIWRSRDKFSHKGHFGHVGLWVSAPGMAGAGILAARAAVYSGAGLCSLLIPEANRQIFQCAIPEAMIAHFTDSVQEDFRYDPRFTYAIGPGIGTGKEVTEKFLGFLQETKAPVVLDADALNILSGTPGGMSLCPKNSILTPHPKEFSRLFGTTADSHEQLTLLSAKAVQYEVIIVLKGHYTRIALPDGRILFNTTGNPGMATGGSGDVLTGIIVSLLAQGYSSAEAAMAGTYLHGKAGDLGAVELGEASMSASDLIDYLPMAIKTITQ